MYLHDVLVGAIPASEYLHVHDILVSEGIPGSEYA